MSTCSELSRASPAACCALSAAAKAAARAAPVVAPDTIAMFAARVRALDDMLDAPASRALHSSTYQFSISFLLSLKLQPP